MINGTNNFASLGNLAGTGGVRSAPPASAGSAGGASFADALRKSIDEVSKLQQDASAAVEDLASGKSEDVTGVMTAVEKSDLAFKTLLAIRAKLMDAYEEIKNIQV
jgi:flagellar hook-basal body complex protein FliE